ncbi:uncharacterized protein AMSG_05033 [Thecamonas trahens ATCC 50062]|uniref:Uncharacterized protein n=1 Tax=Thecamonas trahens ATCC 50062 TaxID=461836 RepID=A0A0L0DCP3_THETB|nr:hypothetical protein AMSG_05033 [Thecamonas trahens ATCC 50062]KNC49073.1 hypothetical protein AMSG_05033 [Thecamonas trahens ATCC 50062]|eukprot:XP_013758104.1 hypothetical protein AMSG_05033 [Thecamonas trahens ATCC 50062]
MLARTGAVRAEVKDAVVDALLVGNNAVLEAVSAHLPHNSPLGWPMEAGVFVEMVLPVVMAGGQSVGSGTDVCGAVHERNHARPETDAADPIAAPADGGASARAAVACGLSTAKLLWRRGSIDAATKSRVLDALLAPRLAPVLLEALLEGIPSVDPLGTPMDPEWFIDGVIPAVDAGDAPQRATRVHPGRSRTTSRKSRKSRKSRSQRKSRRGYSGVDHSHRRHLVVLPL